MNFGALTGAPVNGSLQRLSELTGVEKFTRLLAEDFLKKTRPP